MKYYKTSEPDFMNRKFVFANNQDLDMVNYTKEFIDLDNLDTEQIRQNDELILEVLNNNKSFFIREIEKILKGE